MERPTFSCVAAWLAPVALLVCGCAAADQTGGKAKAGGAPVVAPAVAGNDLADADHKIAPLETINVDVFGEKDLSKELKVSASGKVHMFLLNDVAVAGKTTTELANELKEKLATYLVDPQVIVSIKEYRLRSVNVTGFVVKPGAYPLPGEQKWTILDALGQAGGPDKGGNPNKIELTHLGKTTRYTLKSLNRMSLEKLPLVEPGDTVYVGERIL